MLYAFNDLFRPPLKESSTQAGTGLRVALDSDIPSSWLMAQPTDNTQPETSGRPKRKIVVVLNQCLCGETADPASSVVLECRQTGCETRWVST
jgi:hypothetical protein